jgi:hypothetical protein
LKLKTNTQLTNTVPKEELCSFRIPPSNYEQAFLCVLQKQTSVAPTTEIYRKVPASILTLSASTSTVSHTERRNFKHRLVSTTEDLPSSIPVTTKPRPQSAFVYGQTTALDSRKGGNTQKIKDSVPRSTSSFRRSVALAAGDNWIVPTTASVSSKLYYISKIKT